MPQFTIPGLRTIAAIPSFAIQRKVLRTQPNAKAIISAPAMIIQKFGEANITVEEAPQGQATTTLTFKTLRKISPNLPVAFIAEDNNGDRWLIGSYEPPLPRIETTADTGTTISGQRAIQYKIEWPFPPIPCTIWLPTDMRKPNR